MNDTTKEYNGKMHTQIKCATPYGQEEVGIW